MARCSRKGSALKFRMFHLAAPQGFEPRYADPESAVLPLNEGAAVSRTELTLLEFYGLRPAWSTWAVSPL